ncbi:phosphotyrosine protein phosphatases I [Saccharata proteae CBS 121410]|uniref:Phosphotyrosine protein phosphatases I n=1 Tax=Saccharata proteae CBS 121410 TaxID=1314787 RepID=A0A9P4HTK8_9PEZI|nr:phosphotyrosine protein phosphatases I [Saccharata proteae CBS 121410]
MASEDSSRPVNVLFVCLGNICRSPMAEGVFLHLTKDNPRIGTIDSCGTGAYHVGSSPDSRTMSVLQDNGITKYRHQARKFRDPDDFYNFDYIFPMDDDNLDHLLRLRAKLVKKLVAEGKEDKADGLGKVMLFGDMGGNKGEEVGDPYYGGRDGFEIAYKQLVRFSNGFLKHVGA